MPGSKLSCNSFYMFMLEVKKREEARGKRFPRGLDDVNPLASLEWERMSVDAKQIYKEKAREYKTSQEFRSKKRQSRNRPQRNKAKQKHGDGSSSDDSFTDEENTLFFDFDDEDRFYRRREQDRNNLKTALTWNLGADNLSKKVAAESFYVFATQNYYETPDHDYAPAEIAMVEFALIKGIARQYHAILKPIRIPDHYRNVVGNRVMETHKISPNCPPREARDDFRVVVDEMKSFYSNNKQPNQFRAFVLTKQFNSVQGAIKALRDKTGSKCYIPHEKVSCVEDLFILMCGFKGSNPKRADLIGFTELLSETNWDYEPRTLCPFHSQLQSKHCALAIARKTCYYLFERLKETYGLTLTDHHIPPLSSTGTKSVSAAENVVSSSDYFTLHSIRPPFAALKAFSQMHPPQCEPRPPAAYDTVMSPKELPTSTESKVPSFFTAISPPLTQYCRLPLYSQFQMQQMLKAPNPCSLTIPTLAHHFSSTDASFAPAFSKPPTSTSQGFDPSNVELRRPMTKSFCATIMEDQRVKSVLQSN